MWHLLSIYATVSNKGERQRDQQQQLLIRISAFLLGLVLGHPLLFSAALLDFALLNAMVVELSDVHFGDCDL